MVTDISTELITRGIVRHDDAYTSETVAHLNRVLDSILTPSAAEPRSYVGVDELAALGLLEVIFGAATRTAVDSLFPDGDAVLFQCHVYEIAAGQDRPHIRDRTLDGWHRDSDTVPGYLPTIPQHVSMFTYLSDVGAQGGAFELVPLPPLRRPASGTPRVSMQGPAGTTFWWNRSYFHRASPNRSPVRRRVLKLSFQPRRLPNLLLRGDPFVAASHHVAGLDDPWLASRFGMTSEGPVGQPTAELQLTRVMADGALLLTLGQTFRYAVAEAGRTTLRRVRGRAGARV